MIGRALAALAAAVLSATAGPAAAGHARPLVAILADPSGTETTDLIAPYAILAESGAVDVQVVSSDLAPVPLMPGIGRVKPQASRDSFDRAHPEGPDMVIVPYMMRIDDPARSAWLRTQARRGARIVSICDGALVLASAGLLDGRQATAHWASRKTRLKRWPKVAWRMDARWVDDGRITTTAGVSASVPAALQLVRELAGEPVMLATAARLGLDRPSIAHDARAYQLAPPMLQTAAGNLLAFWGHQKVAVAAGPGFDDLAFATELDGWSRTLRSKAYAVTPAQGAVSRHGLTVLGVTELPGASRQAKLRRGEPIPLMIGDITAAYGRPTARFVALQLEHPASFAP
ncbi:DJ-1/PfpI family protein [Phenylobacterium aquaticum]|uniref:DJ-1/PfpI family protein n=1 Tax=Phenylobacterium aquaticum TaxID=1763816 RepID=UPI0026E9AEC4|nr:DJ-1/PfpI family protein [Phenylobacterium aquaticum]